MIIARAPTLFDARAAQGDGDGRTFAEFFAGVGLARMGLERAGWTIRFANDSDPSKLEMYEGHFGPSPYYSVADVCDLANTPAAVPTVDLAHASFPCTDLSVAGARRGINAGQSSAFWGFHSLLQRMGDRRPALVLLENVPGFLTSNGGADFIAAMQAMNDLGYSVDPICLDAGHFVPQSRQRVFVICSRISGGDTEPNHGPGSEEGEADRLSPSVLRPLPVISAIRQNPSIKWSLRELPDPPPYGSMKLREILDRVPESSDEWWSQDRADYLFAQMSDRHKAVAEAMMAKSAWSSGTVFRRVRHGRSMAELRADGMAGCLRTPKGGSGRQILFQAGYGRYRVRLLNATECARLMGADGYRVTVPLNRALFGFGDAVCVDAVAWIAEHYLNRLVGAED